ncbi:MAG: flagellar basal body P-ring formation chaperone FlgA [Melioribacteraceae bacterium]|nr:flagellar basal body P-ring formation chaperone FlgA [Melioribacteraceae bacterium]
MLSVLLIILNLFSGTAQSDSDLQKYLTKLFSNYEKFEYQVDYKTNNYSRFIVDDERESRLNKNILLVPVKLYDKKNNISNSFISIKVKLFRTVLVAAQDIERDEMLSSYQFRRDLRDVTLTKGLPVTYETNLIGSRSKVKIREGSVLVKEMIETIPDVAANERLILHAGKFGVDITVEVSAREKGSIGEIIRVMTDNKKIFTAKIIDKYNVLLIE